MMPVRPMRWGMTGLAMVAVAWGLAGSAGAAEPARSRAAARGQELFLREWVPGDSRSHGGDGLGPLYNATSCVACHNLGAPGGAGPASKNVDIATLNPRVPVVGDKVIVPGDDVRPLAEYHPGFSRSRRSVVLHRFGTVPDYNSWRLRRVSGVEFADMAEQGGTAALEQVREQVGLRTAQPGANSDPSLAGLAQRGARRAKGQVLLSSIATLSQRNAPALFGAGLIDSIPIDALREAALKNKGRLSTLGDGRFGRFGWKGQIASLKDFVETACAVELGLEVPKQHQARPPHDFSMEHPGLDLTQDECDSLTAFVASLPAPRERNATAGEAEASAIAAGRAAFATVGCTACHLPRLGPVEGIYSDLLLHRMGPALADAGDGYYGSAPEGAQRDEWRTPPLWGFRDSGPYLHDGRAETLDEAVAMHGGQGEESAQRFFKLKLQDRLQVQAFLNSLTVE